MAAPKGNKFWEKRTKHGRDKLFSDPAVLWEECVKYFEWVEKNPLWEAKPFAFQGKVTIKKVPKMRAMTLAGLCVHLGIDRKTWASYRTAEDLLPVITRAEEVITEQKFAGAAAELLNPNIIARDLGLADKKELGGKDGGPIPVTLLKEDEEL